MSSDTLNEVLDQCMVSSLRAFGREPGMLLREMVRDFLVEAPSLMADIERAVDDGAYVDAARAAHNLKGASGHMGATRLAAIASEVESLAKTGVCQAVASATVTARTEVDLAVAAVSALR